MAEVKALRFGQVHKAKMALRSPSSEIAFQGRLHVSFPSWKAAFWKTQ